MSIVNELVIQDLGLENHDLRERVASLEADVESYRYSFKRTIDALHDVTAERDRLRRHNARLVEENRAYRLGRAA